jgi:hypothetical protein
MTDLFLFLLVIHILSHSKNKCLTEDTQLRVLETLDLAIDKKGGSNEQ